jgi:hypothetical protein
MVSKRIEITVDAKTEEDLDEAISEAIDIIAKQLKDGYKSGANSNDERGYCYESRILE